MSCPPIKNQGRKLAMSRLFNIIFKKYITEAYKNGYRFGLTTGVELGKRLAAYEPAVIGFEDKMEKEIEDIIKNKRF
jgi:hypothetical protein